MDKDSQSKTKDPFVRLAEEAIRAYVVDHRHVFPPANLPEEMRRPAGVFVSIKKSGQLRGCIGTFFPSEPTIAHEIAANAVKSATMDPRFPPIEEPELDQLTVSVDVLSTPESCTEDNLDPAIYGIIVQSGGRRGLLLPDLEGVDTVAEQVAITRRKAGIGPHEPIELERFRVERHT
jgi:AmmeMemoRadiSam system protein A